MSKSEPDPKSRICLIDTPEDIIEKFKKSVTDFTSQVGYDPETRPGVSNLVQIHSLCTGQSVEEIVKSVQHLDTGKYKFVVAESLIEFLRPIRSQMLDLLKDPHYLISVLESGGEKATSLAQPVWDSVCYKVGISPQVNWFPGTSASSAQLKN
jgi:tryptophanyl-tRNA synthetase